VIQESFPFVSLVLVDCDSVLDEVALGCKLSVLANPAILLKIIIFLMKRLVTIKGRAGKLPRNLVFE